eukprot:3705527-Karenia_brevis.AAC.1
MVLQQNLSLGEAMQQLGMGAPCKGPEEVSCCRPLLSKIRVPRWFWCLGACNDEEREQQGSAEA